MSDKDRKKEKKKKKVSAIKKKAEKTWEKAKPIVKPIVQEGASALLKEGGKYINNSKTMDKVEKIPLVGPAIRKDGVEYGVKYLDKAIKGKKKSVSQIKYKIKMQFMVF